MMRKAKKNVRKSDPFRVRAVDFVMYNVADMRRAKKFYRELLRLTRGEEYSSFWSEFDTKPTAFALCACGKKNKWWGKPCVALAVDDIHRAIDALRAKGVRILMKPQETNVCWMAFIADPDGNRICLHQRKVGTAG